MVKNRIIVSKDFNAGDGRENNEAVILILQK